ncbi:N-acetylmuramoyl-L-alanine amidase [Tranquillimonas alkanivorans]|uniref:N-acetylmuramoyl-L-alanine amidase n=2 Tax=Tranquillimonas alkanivorans TaxID=441119 RepID=A0A1I5M7U7_9RHOB|nr:N-acetylmuramoyl-L-alanine amidase [Tranquillimonas alkanivorans]
MHIVERPSPNRGPRRGGVRPDMVVIHYTAMASAEAAVRRLCAPEAEVSAHYLVAEDGTVVRMVDEDARAWHAGAGAWGEVSDVNSRSIGIELANDAASPFPEAQMAALEALLQGIMGRWHVSPCRVIGHSDTAPGRKIDPGPRFDWRRLALRGLTVWPGASAVPDSPVSGEEGPRGTDAARLTAALRRCGYTADAAPDVLLAAFRLRVRPHALGPADAVDLALAEDMARRFPVDRVRASA